MKYKQVNHDKYFTIIRLRFIDVYMFIRPKETLECFLYADLYTKLNKKLYKRNKTMYIKLTRYKH